MRYELTDHEWAAIEPFLPNKPRGVPRVNEAPSTRYGPSRQMTRLHHVRPGSRLPRAFSC